MKKLLFVVLLIYMICSFPAWADHSVMTEPGDIDATQAVDHAVESLLTQLKTDENEIRGHWYCSTEYYKTWAWIGGFNGSVWSVRLIDPAVSGTEDGYQIHRSYDYIIDASSGEILEVEANTTWDKINDPEDWQPFYVPTKEQMQPAEALTHARELLMNALNCSPETLNNWNDYMLTASTDENGRFWYHVFMGYGGDLGSFTNPFAWHVYLDANTGEVIWQTNPERLAARWAIQRSGKDWYDWYREQETIYESVWGNGVTCLRLPATL